MIDHLSGTKTLLGHLCLNTLLANLFLEALLGNPCLVSSLGNLFLETCPWKPIPANLAWEPALGNLFLGTFGNLWEPVPGNLALVPWETFSWELVGNLWESLRIFSIFGNLWESWEPCLRTLLGNLFLGTLGASGGNHAREPCLGTFENLFLGTFGNLAWEPLPGNLCEPCLGILLGNLAREPCLGTLLGNLFLGTLGNLAWDGPGFAPGNFSPSAFFFFAGNAASIPSPFAAC